MKPARTPPPAASVVPAQDRQAGFVTTAQVLNFEPGLYEVAITSAQRVLTDLGLVIPCARLDPVRTGGDASAAFAADQGWLTAGSEPAVLRVASGRAGLVLTIYNLPGLPSPSLNFRRIDQPVPQADPGTPHAQPAAPSDPSDPHSRLRMIAHVQDAGDMTVQEGAWVKGPKEASAIEGFSIEGEDGVSSHDIEYQGIIGRDWDTPWESGGQFCGSRNLSLPFQGFRVRLTGDAALRFDCAYSGRFADGALVGPVLNGEACDAGGAPLPGLQLKLLPKQTATESARATPAPEPQATAKPKAARRRPTK